MRPIDIRDQNWVGLRAQLTGRLAAVYTAWVVHGPATTRQLAQRSGIDLLNVRPRTTDLTVLGMVEFVAGNAGEGIYRAVSREQWEAWADASRESSINGQLHLI